MCMNLLPNQSIMNWPALGTFFAPPGMMVDRK